jgi:hypothetical protein
MLKLCVVVLSCAALAGCAERVTPESLCGGDATKGIIKSIIRENWLSAEDQAKVPVALFNESVSIELAAPSKFDADLKRAECSAKLTVAAWAAPDLQENQAMRIALTAMSQGLAGNDFVGEGAKRRYGFTTTYVAQLVDTNLQVNLSGVPSARVDVVTALLRGMAIASAPAASAPPTTVAETPVEPAAPTGAETPKSRPADDPLEGTYTNGTITITRSFGARGRDEFTSSACPDLVLLAKSPEAKSGEAEMAPYEVKAEGDGSFTITGSNRCMPAGTYSRAPSGTSDAAADNVRK